MQQASIDIADNVIYCSGRWTLQNLADLERQIAGLQWPAGAAVTCDASQVTAMDTGGAVLLQEMIVDGRRRGQTRSIRGIPPEPAALLERIGGQHQPLPSERVVARTSWVTGLGELVWHQLGSGVRGLAFLGESAVAMGHAARNPRYIRDRKSTRLNSSHT